MTLQRISVNGSTMLDAKIERNQEAVLILVVTCNDQGTKTLANGGDLDYSKFSLRGGMVVTGSEALALKDRVIESGQAADLETVNGGDSS